MRGVHIHRQPVDSRYDSNFWLCAATMDVDVRYIVECLKEGIVKE